MPNDQNNFSHLYPPPPPPEDRERALALIDDQIGDLQGWLQTLKQVRLDIDERVPGSGWTTHVPNILRAGRFSVE